MKNSFSNKQTDLDLNGPYLSFDTQPQSVTGIGTKVGGTTGATVTLTGISSVGFNPTGTSTFNPPCIAVIDENTGSTQFSVNQDWNNFYAAHPNRKFYLMDVAGSFGDQNVKTPTGIGTGAAPITNFTKFNVNRDEGNTANTSDWFDLSGLSSLPTGSLVTLWVDGSGSMTPSNVQASLDLFLTNCSNAGLNVEQSSNPAAYVEEYIEPFITELVGAPAPENKGSVSFQWHEVGVGPLSDSATITGTATTTLTISNLITPTDNDRQFFLQLDYDPDTATGIGSTGITGNAPNEPFNSGIATVTVTPLIQITTQPVLTTTFPNIETDISVVASLTDSRFADDTQYQWQLDGSDVSNGTITKNGVDTVISGATTPTLTLTSEDSGIGFVARCTVSSATASNSPIVSDSVIYTVDNPTNVINIESIKNAGNQAVLSNTDLVNGEITLNAATSSTASDFFLHCLHAPNKDVDVEMDLFGGGSSGNTSGEGGFSRIRFTMQQNEEYVIAGLTEAINTPFVYRKGTLMVCVGEGGKSNTSGPRGGNGGGIGIVGADASVAGGGQGAPVEPPNGLTLNGSFGSAFQNQPLVYQEDSSGGGPFATAGGVTIRCSKGVYWRQQGVPACSDISGNSQFRLSDGTIVTNTSSITRGYKAGYNIIQTAGGGTTGFRGGNGARGGDGTSNGITAGGGGSGYTDGSVTVVSTQQGGSTGNAKIIIRLQT